MRHGHAAGGKTSPTYVSWRAMRQRCGCPGHVAHSRYAGRNITICARWLSFENFLADMGERPDGLQLDRIDNDKGYEQGNCRWATPKEQADNRRNSVVAEYGGRRRPLIDLSRELGVPLTTMHRRFRSGMSIEEIVVWHRERAARAGRGGWI